MERNRARSRRRADTGRSFRRTMPRPAHGVCMPAIRHLLAVHLALAAPLDAQGPSRTALTSGTWAVTGVNVVPMTRDTVIRDATVVVRDGRITSVGRGGSVPRGPPDRRPGKYLMPGLIDMHAISMPTSMSRLRCALRARSLRGQRRHHGAPHDRNAAAPRCCASRSRRPDRRTATMGCQSAVCRTQRSPQQAGHHAGAGPRGGQRGADAGYDSSR